jgi:GAF domain-containing protein
MMGRGPVTDQPVLFSTLSEFARTLVRPYAIADVLFQLTDRVTAAIDLAGAAVSFADDDGMLRFATASSDALTEVECVQEDTQDGPSVNTFSSGKVHECGDLRDDDRWPAFTKAALAAGFRSIAAIPMAVDGSCIGSINLYGGDAREWTDDELQVAALFADMASIYVANASELERSERIREQLQQALESRVVIEQARGMIARDHNISIDQAFEMLRAHARNRNANLHDVANAVVHLGLRLD